MNVDEWARQILLHAWPQSTAKPTAKELQAVQAVGRYEGFYGRATSPPGWAGSNNWGAIQGGTTDADSFPGKDRHADGTVYSVRFRRYATPEAGASDLVRQLYRRPSVVVALRSGSLLDVARAMRETRYHETRPELYASRLDAVARTIARSLSEPFLGGPSVGLLGMLAFAGLVWLAVRRTR